MSLMDTLPRPAQPMGSTAKTWLSNTVRGLRQDLLKQLHDALESTYRLSIPLSRANLNEERSARRRRLETWLDEQARGSNRGQKESVAECRARHLQTAVKLAGATWLNRLVVLGQMEALGLVRTRIFTGAQESKGFQEFRSDFGPGLCGDDGDGYALVLQLVFGELALDLPGLFGPAGLVELIPMPATTLRHLVDTLQASALSRADRDALWRDDTLLGWIYQFWNDPEREALDEKIRTGGKIENHEIAAKTQLFTDRYMVEWLLQNSLGQIWLEMCQRLGWTADVVSGGVLEALEARRVDWRGKRERGEVDEEALMPLESELEERWKYYVPRPIQAGEGIPNRLSKLKLFDPACGSGHFLVIAFDLLAALYEEEARHRGETLSREQIAQSIVENNLHGLDIDPRAVQIAAAALWLKVKSFAPRVEFGRLNLVASNLGLGSLPVDDPALTELLTQVEAETGIPARFTLRLVETLKGADHLGSLLKVGEALDQAVLAQAPLLAEQALTLEEARAALLSRLEQFVASHSRSEDLGLRLRGEQLASGVRFIRLVREGQYHLVVGNPPYQSRGKLASKWMEALAVPARTELFAAFMMRAQEFLLRGGRSGYVTLSNWQFLGAFEALRKHIASTQLIELLADLGKSAFSSGSALISSSMHVFRKQLQSNGSFSIAQRVRTAGAATNVEAVQATLLAGHERYDFRPEDLRAIPGQPLIYWWDKEFLSKYASVPLLGEVGRARQGTATADNTRFLRLPWEVAPSCLDLLRPGSIGQPHSSWVPYIKGAAGLSWFEPVTCLIRWTSRMLELYLFPRSFPKNESYNFKPGVAFSMIGSSFTARAHRFRSVFGHKGSSVFPDDIPGTLCLMNSRLAKDVLESLNPGIGFEVGDVNRLPLFPIESADEIYAQIDLAFTQHEQARETSVEFKRPGPSPWKYAQAWAQHAVDRPAGAPLPEYNPIENPQSSLDELSYQLGLALGRFDENGIADRAPAKALPHGILFLTASGGPDSLEHPAAHNLKEHGKYLREKFFTEDHLKRYEKRPIYFPLSSEKKNFVAWCSIHRWTDQTLLHVLELLVTEQNRLNAELADAAQARTSGDRSAQVAAHKRHETLLNLLTELQTFMRQVQNIAERGAPPANGCTPREVDAPFHMDLDDGVMINSAALWPLLLPQWKDPKTWWAELCNAKGKKDYDWSHLAARYFPTRVDGKCQTDPSLAVAHGVFWKYHPEKAYQWELRLQSPDELGPDFRLDEPGSDAYRADFETNHPEKVRELRIAEQRRRERKQSAPAETDQAELEFDEEDESA